MRNVFSLCFSIFVFLSHCPGKPVVFFGGQKKAQFPCFFGRSSITSSHSETRIPIAFFCMPDLRALPLRSTCICPVRLHMVSYLNIFFIKCLQVQSFILKTRKLTIAAHVLLYIFCMIFSCKFCSIQKHLPALIRTDVHSFDTYSLRWHYPNQVRSKIYLPLSLSHKLPFFILSYHSTNL